MTRPVPRWRYKFVPPYRYKNSSERVRRKSDPMLWAWASDRALVRTRRSLNTTVAPPLRKLPASRNERAAGGIPCRGAGVPPLIRDVLVAVTSADERSR